MPNINLTNTLNHQSHIVSIIIFSLLLMCYHSFFLFVICLFEDDKKNSKDKYIFVLLLKK